MKAEYTELAVGKCTEMVQGFADEFGVSPGIATVETRLCGDGIRDKAGLRRVGDLNG